MLLKSANCKNSKSNIKTLIMKVAPQATKVAKRKMMTQEEAQELSATNSDDHI